MQFLLICFFFYSSFYSDQDAYFLQTLKQACARGLVIVNVTQCHRGSVKTHYATGTALAEAGVVSGSDSELFIVVALSFVNLVKYFTSTENIVLFFHLPLS